MAPQAGNETIPRAAEPLSGQDWLADIRALPTLPSVLFRFLGLVGDPAVDTGELARYIWNDPALLSRALPLAASRNRSQGPAGSLVQSIASLGRERIRSVAFTTPLLRSFEPIGTGSFATTFWERSLICATVCQTAAEYLKLANPDRYYAAGLLHDIGYLVLLQKRPILLPTILQQWAGRPARLLEIEDELMGMDHCRLGLHVAARLGLEPWIFPAIEAHHSATQDSDPIARLTAIAGAFASYQGVDFFPRRSLSRTTREREMQEILRVFLPDLDDESRTHLLEAMENAVQPIRNGIRDTIVEWQVAGESRVRPYFTRQPMRPASPPVMG